MALADHKPARKRGHLEHVITTLDTEDQATLTEEDRELLLSWLHDTSFTDASIAEILTDEGRPTRGYHVTHWRDRNLKGANK